MTAHHPDVVTDLQRENARLQAALRASQDRQNASAEILRTIANSSGDAEQSLQRIAEITAHLFDAPSVSIQLAQEGEWTQSFRFGTSAERVRSAVPLAMIRIGGPNLPGTVVAENRQIHIPDLDHLDPSMADWPGPPHARAAGTRTMCGTPLRREGKAIGVLIIYRDRLLPFTEVELALLQSFADQAVIAIENARLFDEVQQRTADLTEALQRQTAVGDVLKTISRSTFDLQPVLDTLVETAARLCDAEMAFIMRREGEVYRAGAAVGFSDSYIEFLRNHPISVNRGSITGRAVLERRTVQILDVATDPEYTLRESTTLARQHTALCVPLLREKEPIGTIVLARQRVEPFSQKQIDLVTTFADQAVIAIENVRLFDQVRQRTSDLQEALTYQTGSAKILSVIASSPTDVGPVLKAIVDSACEICDAYDALVMLKDGSDLRFSAHHGPIPFDFETWPLNRSWVTGRSVIDKMPVHIHDLLSSEGDEYPEGQDMVRRQGHRTVLSVPMMREGESIGAIVLRRTEVHPFSDKQIALLQTFADQAVIAIENVRLFDEVQARTRDLSESLQQQTAMAEVLKVISRSAFDLDSVLTTLVGSAATLCEAERGLIFLRQANLFHMAANHGFSPELEAFAREHPFSMDGGSTTARAAASGIAVQTVDLLADKTQGELARQYQQLGGHRSNLGVPLRREGQTIGIFTLTRQTVRPFTEKQIALVSTFADQAVIAIENARLFDEVQARTRELAASLDELRTAQDRLVQTEKLASLGQLTAGIAHEIKNPLNFVNNFAALSAELTDELKEVLRSATVSDKIRAEVDELAGLLKDNLQKVVQHGNRADSIVKNMLLHSREGSGEHRPADINALVDESLNLAYHGARAEKPNFNVTLRRDFDPGAGIVELFPQEITRVILNLVSNGFYALNKRRNEDGSYGFDPVLSAATRSLGDGVEIRIRDNGTGIPPEVRDKMFNPFFTTKPAGEGTGLGLSMSHDIIVKQHGGTISVETEPGQFTEFRIVLPRSKNLSTDNEVTT